jgi:hypothetical protein
MRLIFTTLFFLTLHLTASAQENTVSADQALDLFRQKNFAEALPMYEHLIERYDRDPKYNYYYGVCLVDQRQDHSEAIRRLKFALSKRVNKDAHYYLGQAYQNNYQFEEAKEEFSAFVNYANSDDARRTKAQQAIENCESGEKLINKYFNITIVDKDTISSNDYLQAYKIPEDAGTLARNKSFFKTGVPPENIMYRTEKGDEVYFVLEEADAGIHDIYKMEQLLDRWSSSKNLGTPVNSDYDDRNPFLMVDGTTFFFASDRPGGMGGLDIYRSIYDPESNTFSKPENLGPPFNSPADDYLFAADPFGNRAWFTTNRGIKPGTVVVAKIVWDHNVIKKLTEDTDLIREIARLPLADGSLSVENEKSPEKTNLNGALEEEFRFHINDTIIYTRYENFQSTAALSEFKRGHAIDMKKDSLEQLMRHKRQRYSQSYNQSELNQLMNEILELEKTVYGHDDQVKRHLRRARQLESEKLSELINSGRYNEGIQNGIQKPSDYETLNSLMPGDYTFYTDQEFNKRRQRLTPIYQSFFSPPQIKTLRKTDSIYTWANILKLEAANILESTVSNGDTKNDDSFLERMRNIDSLNNNEEEEDENTRQRIQKARETQKKALDMYHYALNTKFELYYPTLQSLAKQSGNKDLKLVAEKAHSYFVEANNSLEKIHPGNIERYEQMGSLKRQATELMEAEMLASLESGVSSLTNQTPQKNTNTITPSSEKTDTKQKREEDTSEKNLRKPTNNATPDSIVKSVFDQPEEQTTSQPVFKIQIGVFRSTPNQDALAAIPEVTSLPVSGKDITRYFSGNWDSYAEAQKQVNPIRKKGFPGAFVVAFLNGKQISPDEAREMSREE